jgi:hypothetical protein
MANSIELDGIKRYEKAIKQIISTLTGPIGPTGLTGPIGPTGPTGPAEGLVRNGVGM